MFNADALKRWFDEFFKDAKQVYWSLHKASGGQKGPKLALHECNDISESWQYLYDTISNQMQQGVREFVVIVRKAKNDPNTVHYFLNTGYTVGQQQQNAISGHGAQTPPVNIGEIEARLEQKYQERLNHEIEKLQFQRQLEKMEELIEGIQHERRDFVDKLVDGVERILGVIDNPAVAGLLTNVLTKRQTPAGGVSGGFKIMEQQPDEQPNQSEPEMSSAEIEKLKE
ncbi:MAG: hypothetical protein D6706_08020, partial [Chloroflexi bacterium]